MNRVLGNAWRIAPHSSVKIPALFLGEGLGSEVGVSRSKEWIDRRHRLAIHSESTNAHELPSFQHGPSLGDPMAPAASNLLSKSALGHRLRSGPSRAWQQLNDWWLGIDTVHDPVQQHPVQYSRNGEADYWCHYQGANYLHLHQIARRLTDNGARHGVFYDIGCGKGRPLCVMARYPFAKVVGIELRPDLCATAERNASRLRGRVAPIEIKNCDAATADMSDGNVFFFFNPFGLPTFRLVLASIERSLRVRPRKLTLIYYNAVFEKLLEGCSWLERVDSLPTLSGLRVSFWKNRESPTTDS